MPLALLLPTTSRLDLSQFFTSPSHPSFPSTATSYRGVLGNSLKSHKRLPPSSQSAHLSGVSTAASDYLPFIWALDRARKGHEVAGEKIVVEELRPLTSAWRSTLAAGRPGRDFSKVKIIGIEQELAYVVSVKATASYLQARAQLHTLYDSAVLTSNQRVVAIQTAVKYFLEASTAYSWLSQYSRITPHPVAIADISLSTFSALNSLTLAEATLATVLKDDPYPALVLQSRNKNDKEWMIKSPELPRVRAHLFARLCLSSAEHAEIARATILSQTTKAIDKLPDYLHDLKCCARAKACRFLGIDAELSGRIGESIAWLRAAKAEIVSSGAIQDVDSSLMGIKKWRHERAEKHEDRKIMKSGDWGGDAGKMEEARVITLLLDKWTKINDTVNFQTIPTIPQVIANLPSGRDFYSSEPMTIQILNTSTLERLRAPPDPLSGRPQDVENSSDEEDVHTRTSYY